MKKYKLREILKKDNIKNSDTVFISKYISEQISIFIKNDKELFGETGLIAKIAEKFKLSLRIRFVRTHQKKCRKIVDECVCKFK